MNETLNYPNFQTVIDRMPNGWCTVEKAQHLFELTIQSGAKRSIELGVFSGRSLIPIALAHQELNTGFVIGVDSWSKRAALEGTNDEANAQWWSQINFMGIYEECIDAIDYYQLNDYCGTVRLKSMTFGQLIEDNSISLLHQDSNHSEEVTCGEVELFASKIMKGGIWVSDDSRWPTIQRSLSLLEEKGFRLIGEFANGVNWYKVFIKL